jgi:hypothetical protein
MFAMTPTYALLLTFFLHLTREGKYFEDSYPFNGSDGGQTQQISQQIFLMGEKSEAPVYSRGIMQWTAISRK